MDRIRDAVLRARDAAEHRRDPTATGHGGATLRRSAADAPPLSAFRTIACDEDGLVDHRIISNEQDPVLNAYRVLRTRVLQRMEENGWRTLAVVSPGAGAGKTVTSINLAIAIASAAGSRTTLVDLDFYRPRIAHYLGFEEPAPSVLDFLSGDAALQDVTVNTGLANLLVMANERVTRRGAELLTSPKMDALIDGALSDFGSRVVIFDMSPALGCDDTIAFLPKVDCVLLVAASGQTRVGELKEAQRALRGANIVGTVLNKAPAGMVGPQYY